MRDNTHDLEPEAPKTKTRPNRKDRRRARLRNVRIGKTHARIAGMHKTPASFHTLVLLVQKTMDDNGRVLSTKKVVMPREMVEVK